MSRQNYSALLMELTEKLARIDGVGAIVLYGSFARGDYGAKSDVDLLIITEKGVSREKLMKSINAYEGRLGRAITLDIITPKEFSGASQLIYNVLSEGRILYKSPMLELPMPAALLGTWKPMVCYSLSHAIAKLSRVLRGYESKKGKYRYKYKGAVETHGGKILAKGVFLVPASDEKFFDDLLKAHRTKYKKEMILYAFSG